MNALTTVEIDPKNILTLSQLANLDPSAIKAIMEQRLKDMNWTTYQLAKAYGALKEGRSDINQNALQNAKETAAFKAVKRLLGSTAMAKQSNSVGKPIRTNCQLRRT